MAFLLNKEKNKYIELNLFTTNEKDWIAYSMCGGNIYQQTRKELCSVVKRVDTFLNTIFRKDRITPGFPCRIPLFHLVYNHQAKSEGV